VCPHTVITDSLDHSDSVPLRLNLLLLLVASFLPFPTLLLAEYTGDPEDEDVKTLTNRLTPTLGGYVLMIGMGWFLPVVAVLGYLAPENRSPGPMRVGPLIGRSGYLCAGTAVIPRRGHRDSLVQQRPQSDSLSW